MSTIVIRQSGRVQRVITQHQCYVRIMNLEHHLVATYTVIYDRVSVGQRWNALSVLRKYMILDYSVADRIDCLASLMEKILHSNNSHNHGYYTGSSVKSNHLIPFSFFLAKRRKQR